MVFLSLYEPRIEGSTYSVELVIYSKRNNDNADSTKSGRYRKRRQQRDNRRRRERERGREKEIQRRQPANLNSKESTRRNLVLVAQASRENKLQVRYRSVTDFDVTLYCIQCRSPSSFPSLYDYLLYGCTQLAAIKYIVYK